MEEKQGLLCKILNSIEWDATVLSSAVSPLEGYAYVEQKL
jgi:hypothetical protein